ncbi:hypothetical protein TrLO_g14765 [Triparma laevis f. longispina]|uniref:Uncharacterized protein n=1 Tax=Triparma laevis f. longispina TaxID=1714387 RepID=A0A9W7DTN2_9STRA|nr:hypothetical protein TrLO_g14765 [Triparma laevis f. longispina]
MDEGSRDNLRTFLTLIATGREPPMDELWRGAEEQVVKKAGDEFERLLIKSGVDVEGAVSEWFAGSVLSKNIKKVEHERLEKFLIIIAKRNVTRVKMSRLGVGMKMSLTLLLGYMDIITDLLVAKSYYEVEDYTTAYGIAGCALLAILLQAVVTFFQYGAKHVPERLGRTFVALVGLGPLVEGANVWTGKEDPELVCKGPQMYAIIKAFDIAFESIPESIIQIGGLLNANSENNVKMIHIIGVFSSMVAGAFIMTDGNFGMILNKHLGSPGDPYYKWISKVGDRPKHRQMLGMFLFNACYFAQFVFTMSLFAKAFNSDNFYLDLETGMDSYAFSLGLAAIGFAMFMYYCSDNFDRGLFWKPKSGKERTKDCWRDEQIWEKKFTTKDEEIYKGWIEEFHPAYLPFPEMTAWISENLVTKYENKTAERPEWMVGKNEGKFIKRIVVLYEWRRDYVNGALARLFGRNGEDLELGVEGQLSFIKRKKSFKGLGGRVKPE